MAAPVPRLAPLLLLLLLAGAAHALTLAPRAARLTPRAAVRMSFFSDFFRELDNFVDDATSRRLGNGSKFYGKRKSSFYGADDAERKSGAEGEDYTGPAGGSYFVLSKERDDQGRPLRFLSRKEAREIARKEEEERWARLGQSDDLRQQFKEAVEREGSGEP
ncbi:hypothetical protein AB1Y20_007186 [Prymnesium parvum]|uniref:Uncharacterized protein n=1 Tax=Prymnesium parvum TaxID=97485 RepID=A0AB34IU56_PRYPA